MIEWFILINQIWFHQIGEYSAQQKPMLVLLKGQLQFIRFLMIDSVIQDGTVTWHDVDKTVLKKSQRS